MKISLLLSTIITVAVFVSCKSRETSPQKTTSIAQVSKPVLFEDVIVVPQDLTCPDKVFPTSYRLLQVDYPALRKLMVIQGETAGALANDTIILSIPLPEGGIEDFTMTQVKVMAPELAAKFPNIKTYSGTSNIYATDKIRADISPQGFRAMIQSSRGAIVIDPYCKNDSIHVISYYRKYLPENSKEDFER
ncbi:MAG: hypothetical protein IPL74_03415 [Bacteroidetes bacterium]|nr:hypothetical protein [Bacteroidota bacterium]